MATYEIDYNDLPYQRNFNCAAGEDIIWPVAFTFNDNLLDLSSATLKLTVWDETDAAIIDARSVAVDDAANNDVTLAMPASDTKDMAGWYTYELMADIPSGSAFPAGADRRLLHGTISVTPRS